MPLPTLGGVFLRCFPSGYKVFHLIRSGGTLPNEPSVTMDTRHATVGSRPILDDRSSKHPG